MDESSMFFATCPKGIEELLYQELVSLNVDGPKQKLAGVHFGGDILTAYRVCLWSRLANRVLMPLAHFKAKTTDELYDNVRSLVSWNEHMEVDGSLAVDFAGGGSNGFHSHYAALRVKDAIVDQFNARFGERPSIDTKEPDIRINVYMKRDQATLSLDLSGNSLHRRGYRKEGGIAPLKENLAAAVLMRAGWPAIAKKNVTLVDPMCGSGTLVIEAAMMVLDMAPGLKREYFGFLKWKPHNRSAWMKLLQEAHKRAEEALRDTRGMLFLGLDKDRRAIEQSSANATRAGLLKFIKFDCRDIDNLKAPDPHTSGLIIANPPYGERMGEKKSLESLYRCLGDRLKEGFSGWEACIFTANPDLAKHMGIRAKKHYKLFNGALPCRVLNFEINESWHMHEMSPGRPLLEKKKNSIPDPGAEMFANRVRKNLKNIGKWARKNGITCYRLYDADMPEYAVAVDIYGNWVHVQEYQAPAGVLPENAKHRLNQIMSVLPDVLNIPPENIISKIRKKTRGKEQYEKMGSSGRFFQVQENDLRFLVNLMDYLDTGLFLDHRITRQMIKDYSDTKSVLNLFCYTGTATVCAAAGGARNTTSVDMSNVYISWAEKNLELNGHKNSSHELIRADCLEWVTRCKDQYDLIFLDPPTFSNSKRMNDSFDLQRDHVDLLKQTLKLLSPGGLLIFSCNRRKFKMETDALKGWSIKNITRATIPKDFERNKRIHHTFEIRGKRI